jgi:ankyrin repeat protein
MRQGRRNLDYLSKEGYNSDFVLWEAARDGDAEVVSKLLELYNTPDYINCKQYGYGTTPLAEAVKWSDLCRHGYFCSNYRRRVDHNDKHLAVVKLLLNHGADVSIICDDESTALHYAIIQAPSNEYLKLLIDSGQNMQVDFKTDGKTPFMRACESKSHLGDAQWKEKVSLLMHISDVHTVDGKGNSILHQMYFSSHWLFDQLISLGIDINRRCRHGRTPLLFAMKKMRKHRWIGDYILRLLERGADIHIKDDNGETVIDVGESFLPPDNRVLQILYEKNNEDKMLMFSMGAHPRTNPGCYVRNLGPDHLLSIEHQRN